MLAAPTIDPTHPLELDLFRLRLEFGLEIIGVDGGTRHDGLDQAQPLAFELRRDPRKLRVGGVMHRPCEFAQKVGRVETLGKGVRARARISLIETSD